MVPVFFVMFGMVWNISNDVPRMPDSVKQNFTILFRMLFRRCLLMVCTHAIVCEHCINRNKTKHTKKTAEKDGASTR